MKDEIIALQKKLLDIKTKKELLLKQEIENKTKEINNIHLQVKTLLEERELLLREIYHRVKNNFQAIISIIWFESKKFPQSKQNFMELINRIKSMSIVYEFLYNSKDLSNINLLEYLNKITQNLIMTYKQKDLSINQTIPNINVDFNSAIVLGVITNEILSNSIKHNNKQKPCIIDIDLKKEQNSISLSIKDNGKGFCLEKTKDGIGLALVKEFTKKLDDGEYNFSFEDGTKFELYFKSYLF